MGAPEDRQQIKLAMPASAMSGIVSLNTIMSTHSLPLKVITAVIKQDYAARHREMHGLKAHV